MSLKQKNSASACALATALLLLLPLLPGLVWAEPKLITEYEPAEIDCPTRLADRPGLILLEGYARRPGPLDITSYKPEPIKTVMREVEHTNRFVALHDDWILVCHLHRPNTTEGVDIELPVPGYLLRLDTITVGPMNKDHVLRLTGTYLREKRPPPAR